MKSKELNPELFGEIHPVEHTKKNHLLESMKLGAPMQPLDFDEEVQSTQKELSELKGDVHHLKDEFQENQQNTKLRLDRLQVSLTKLEEGYSEFVHEVGEKMHQISSRFGEQKKYDQKIQELIDRHNNLLKGYEIRMNQTQRILAQKESELIEVHTLLNNTKMELARMKRF
ncbi:MAG: hypothetical protein AABY64_07405 [Bdellovibrionota bacterium]